jgi:molecular chaperone DnaK
LQQAQHKLAEAMYKAAGSAPGAGGQPGAGPSAGDGAGAGASAGAKKDDVVDAEFVDVDDKKKN